MNDAAWSDFKVLLAVSRSGHRAPGPLWPEEHKGTAKIALRADNTDVVGHAVASGVGIGVVPWFAGTGRPEFVRAPA